MYIIISAITINSEDSRRKMNVTKESYDMIMRSKGRNISTGFLDLSHLPKFGVLYLKCHQIAQPKFQETHLHLPYILYYFTLFLSMLYS